MPRAAAQLPLVLPPREASAPVGRWLYAALRTAVLGGRLPPGSRLPSTRDLAREYRLSRGTVVTAFDRLLAEGYLEARVGSGTRVARELPSAVRLGVRGRA
ncbi:MAG TPA: winged helix-turn-helix domain-containing protein, partial [Gemmatimonadales bacterium]|nr:winged helix-turn-helix domain-containing protein [Gemmatimonadales bacterium]